MTALDLRSLGKLASALLIGAALAGTPALADKGGNGGGNGGGNSHAGGNGNGNGGGNGNAHGGNAKAGQGQDHAMAAKTAKAGGTASRYGNLNGFLHASATGISHASTSSVLGKVRSTYGAAVQAYLDGSGTSADAQAALAAIANKPVTADMVTAINDKLVKIGVLDIDQTQLDQLNTDLTAGL